MVNSARIAALLAACSAFGVRLFSIVYTSVALIPPALAAVSKPNSFIISLVLALFATVAETSPASANLYIPPPVELRLYPGDDFPNIFATSLDPAIDGLRLSPTAFLPFTPCAL